jgi:hypothetical protein
MKRPRARKIDRQKVLELHEQGLSIVDIAQHQQVDRSAIWRFLHSTEPERKALAYFKANRADVLARLQAKSLDVQERILDTLDDGVVKALTPSQKSSLLMSLNAQGGTLYDKERIETGKSTQNISVMGRVMAEVHQNLFKKPYVREEVALPTEECYFEKSPEGDPSGEKPGAGGPERPGVAIG